MTKKSCSNAKIRLVGITNLAYDLIDCRRRQIYSETGILKPRYDIVSETIIAAYGGNPVNSLNQEV